MNTIDIVYMDETTEQVKGTAVIRTYGDEGVLIITCRDGSVLNTPLMNVRSWRVWPR